LPANPAGLENERKREYGTNGNNGTDGRLLGFFRLFRYFRLFRILKGHLSQAFPYSPAGSSLLLPLPVVLGIKKQFGRR
jgi:hypothetical protein